MEYQMKTIVFLLSLTVLASCASKKVQDEVRAEVAQETSSNKDSLGQTINDQINNSTTLTEDQKKQLVEILRINKETAEKLTEESYKLRAVLIKELLSAKMNSKKISIIKKDIKKIEAARLKNTFDTAEKIGKIVNKNPEHSDAFVDHFMILDRPNRASK